MTIDFIPANGKNFTIGRQGNTPQYVVCHWIVGHLAAADATFQDPNRVASAHYGVEGSTVHQYVRDKDTAYANGNWDWNLKALSIEHAGGPDIPITDATYETSATLIADLCRQYAIPLDRDHVKRHQEVSDNPTACPGALDVDRLVRRARELQASGGAETMTKDQEITSLTSNAYYAMTGDKIAQNELDKIKMDMDLQGHYEAGHPEAAVNMVHNLVLRYKNDGNWPLRRFVLDWFEHTPLLKRLEDDQIAMQSQQNQLNDVTTKAQQDAAQIMELTKALANASKPGEVEKLQESNRIMLYQSREDAKTIKELQRQLEAKPIDTSLPDTRSGLELIRAGINKWLGGS